MKKIINFHTLLLPLIGFFVFLFSLLVAPYHVNGDQAYYLAAFDEIKGSKLSDGFFIYQTHIFTKEPVHFFISWISSNIGISKNIIMSSFNSLLVTLFAKILFEKRYPTWLVLILICNSYIMAMLFTLERNKIAFVFVFMLILYRNLFFYIFAILSHASTVIILLPSILINLLGKNKILHSKKYLLILLMSIFILFEFNFFIQHLADKFSAYSDPNMNEGGYPLLLFAIFLLTLLFAESKKTVFIYFAPLIFLFFFIGPTRLNMYGFFIYLFLSNARNKYFQALTGCIGLYFILKSGMYLDNVINFGG